MITKGLTFIISCFIPKYFSYLQEKKYSFSVKLLAKDQVPIDSCHLNDSDDSFIAVANGKNPLLL